MLTLALLMLSLSGCALANDGYLSPYAGAAEPLGTHASIIMESADIDLALFEDHAAGWCAYVFYNDGPATTVTMGFPVFEGGQEGERVKPRLPQFRSKVDGVPVKVTTLEKKDKQGRTTFWYVKDVQFERGQRRTIINRFRQGYGDSTMGDNFFVYVVSTARSWRGPVERLGIEIHWYGKSLWERLEVTGVAEGKVPKPATHKGGRTLMWSLVNCEPEWDLHLRFWTKQNWDEYQERLAEGK